MPADTFYVYMVRCSNGALYTGMTTDVPRRVGEHNAARGARYTAVHAPVDLVWTEAHPDRSSAMKREAQIKKLSRLKKLTLISRPSAPAKKAPLADGNGAGERRERSVKRRAGADATLPLSETAYARGCRYLAKRDPDLASIRSELGSPPMWARDPGFPTLVQIILEQQVSLQSARAAFEKLSASAAPLTPRRFLKLEDASLKSFGFSRQKAAYCRQLAQSIVEGDLDLDLLAAMDTPEAVTALQRVKGIGRWTADIYLLAALRRPDVWPSGDMALASAVQMVKRLPVRPSPDELEEMSQAWHPWRAVAARMLWHYYLNRARPRR
jgi:DNA-3-methyladenine glycosylase II